MAIFFTFTTKSEAPLSNKPRQNLLKLYDPLRRLGQELISLPIDLMTLGQVMEVIHENAAETGDEIMMREKTLLMDHMDLTTVWTQMIAMATEVGAVPFTVIT